ncbi:MAG TPA: glycosyltransferase family 4 protein [Steroidobacteraceae bacterium]|nr:glycosyltransferase family 4 protein [Steroidobacteraceae bacterium]
MKIALVAPGGVSNQATHSIPALMWLVGRLAKRHTVKVYLLHRAPAPSRENVLGTEVMNDGGALRHLRLIQAIRAEHRRAPFDVVHSIWAGNVGLVGALAARRIGRPHLVHLGGGELAKLRGIGYGGALSLRNRCMNRWVFKRAAVVSAASAPMIEAAREFGARAVRIPLGVDREAFPPRPPVARVTSRAVRLVQVASLNLIKDQAMLLRAVAQLVAAGRDVELDIAGMDALNGEIQALARKLGVDARVRFHGWVDSARVRELVAGADIYVLSSLHEAGPLAVLEAAMLGVPTVGTQVGHVSEWAPHASLAGPPGDAATLAANLMRLMDDESLRLTLAGEAQRRALTDDADCTARLFEAQYGAAVASHGGGG